ncbi:DUF1648 domain-containing protein [Paenibacillus sp. GCM10027627]|uniref:DUF1648 domain-containing protein n=1 Tax=unclassified Paenibacillus TaxID=185978 RepID=UPI003641EE51
MTNGLMIGLSAMILFPLVCLMTIMPLLTRKIESFGVTVPEQAQGDASIVKLRRQYVWLNAGAGVILTASLMWWSKTGGSEERWATLLIVHVFGYLLLSFAVYLKQHNAVKRMKEQKGWLTDQTQRIMASTSFRNQKLVLSSYWFIPHAIVILATVVICLVNYDAFPNQIPMKYDLDGTVVRSIDKTYVAVLWQSMVQSFLLLVFILGNLSIGWSKQVVEGANPEASLIRNRKFRRYWSTYMVVSGFALIASFALIPIGLLLEWHANTNIYSILAIALFMLVYAIVLSIVAGQGGSRIKLTSGEGTGQSKPMADQDQYWKLGQIYFNPHDPSLFVEKRFGIGWTMNFAKPIVWVIMVALLAAPFVIVFIVES